MRWPKQTTIERFWSHVDKNGPVPKHAPELGPCWIWMAFKKDGYGRFMLSKEEGTVASHRWIFEQTNSQIPSGLLACHKCDNPSCVRPDHIYAGTHKDNWRDCVTRGRYRNQHTSKTHCPKGHTLSGENLRLTKSGKYTFRVCKKCQRANLQNYRSKIKTKVRVGNPESSDEVHIVHRGHLAKPPPPPARLEPPGMLFEPDTL